MDPLPGGAGRGPPGPPWRIWDSYVCYTLRSRLSQSKIFKKVDKHRTKIVQKKIGRSPWHDGERQS